MRRLPALLRAGLRQNFGLALLRHKVFKERKDLWLVLLAALGFLCLLPVIWLYFSVLKYAYTNLKLMGQETALLTLAILAGQFLIMVFGLFYVLSAFYFARDLEFLVSLPARPFEVIAAKFGVILVNEYLTVLFIVAPAFIVYGVMAAKPFAYWLLAALVFLLLPVIPLALAGLLVMAMMRLVNISRKKDFLVLAMALDAGIVYAFYYLSQFLRGAGIDGAALIFALIAITSALAAAAVFLLARFAGKRYKTIAI
jgi:ABC-2 type transport system permease protein